MREGSVEADAAAVSLQYVHSGSRAHSRPDEEQGRRRKFRVRKVLNPIPTKSTVRACCNPLGDRIRSFECRLGAVVGKVIVSPIVSQVHIAERADIHEIGVRISRVGGVLSENLVR